MAGHHGQTLPWAVPQEQDAQGEAHEDPKEPKVNHVRISYKCFVNTNPENNQLFNVFTSKLAFSSREEEDREVVSY